MIVMPDGKTIGTIGGGAVEAQVIEKAVSCIASGTDRLFVADMLGEKALGSDPICGGSVTAAIFLADDKGAYVEAAACLERGEPVVLASILPVAAATADEVRRGRIVDGSVAVINAEGDVVYGSLEKPDEAILRKTLETGLPVMSDLDGRLYDPLIPRERLLILGGGHVGQALAILSVNLDFQVCVADSRPEFVEPGRFPAGVETRQGGFTDLIDGFPAGSTTYVVVVSPGHSTDLECVRALLKREYRYAGFIGSRRKVRMILDQVLSEGYPADRVNALRAPIGMDIRAETPAEIAVAILAELIAARREAPALAAMDAARVARRA
jgi:xanthine dehydrogenase accessory factor